MGPSSSWELSNYSVTQEIPNNLWYPNIHFCVHKRLPLTPIPSQMNPIRSVSSYYIMINFNIVTFVSDYKRGLDWWSDLLDYLIQDVTTLYSSLLYIYISAHSHVFTSRCSVEACQRWTFPFLPVPELSPCLSYQLLTPTTHNYWTPAVIWLTHQPHTNRLLLTPDLSCL
jgi:hypothetical protein